MGYRTFSPYFGPPRPTPATVRMVAVPPADTTAFLFFYVSNKDENIRLLRYRTGKRVQLVTNAKSLRSYYAKRRKKRAPVTSVYFVYFPLSSLLTSTVSPLFILQFLSFSAQNSINSSVLSPLTRCIARSYEMRWEIACAQRWKCKACKKLLPCALY